MMQYIKLHDTYALTMKAKVLRAVYAMIFKYNCRGGIDDLHISSIAMRLKTKQQNGQSKV